MSQKARLKNRLQKLRKELKEKEFDGIIIAQAENRYYLSGFDGSYGFLLITLNKAILATDSRYTEQAKLEAPDYDIFKTSGDIAKWMPELIAGVDLNNVGFESDRLSFEIYRQLNEILSKEKIKFAPITGLVEALRQIKEPEEIELITKAAAIADIAITHITDAIKAGMTEKEAAWEIERFMREQGSESVPFNVIVASGPNTALPHAKPSERKIGRGEPVVIDIGAKVGGYCSDLSRTICLGKPDDTFKKVYDSVLGAQLAAIAIIKAGISGSEADNIAREIFKQTGYSEAFSHGLGHGIGLAVHEMPRLGPSSTDKLNDGMVFTIEPGVYLSSWGGVRIEDTVVMENGKIREISKAKK